MKPHRVIKNPSKNVGEPSSKYGYDRTGEQFERDIQAHAERSEWLWAEFVNFMQSNNIRPDEFRCMFSRYYEEFIV